MTLHPPCPARRQHKTGARLKLPTDCTRTVDYEYRYRSYRYVTTVSSFVAASLALLQNLGDLLGPEIPFQNGKNKH
jgi:hypothetical protein